MPFDDTIDKPVVRAVIDGRAVAAPTGASILEAARQTGANIPRLCASDHLKPFGSRRLRLVEIEGRPGTPASCTPDGTPVMHVEGFVRGKGKFIVTKYIPTDEKTGPRFPLLLTTGRILSQYNVGAQNRRTANVAWHHEDVLEVHPHDAEDRGLKDDDWVRLGSRTGSTTLRAKVTDRVAPGVVYRTFHHPTTQANVVTTKYSEWATNCPEYKVTAVQVSSPNGSSDWQPRQDLMTRRSRRISKAETS